MRRMTPGEVRIGTSGWSYDHWKDVLYPPGAYTKRLEAYVAEFDTGELNGSFYRWPRASVFEGWRERVPPGFLMAVKAPRGLTHARKLRDPDEWGRRIGDGLDALGDAAGGGAAAWAPLLGGRAIDDLMLQGVARLHDGQP